MEDIPTLEQKMLYTTLVAFSSSICLLNDRQALWSSVSDIVLWQMFRYSELSSHQWRGFPGYASSNTSCRFVVIIHIPQSYYMFHSNCRLSEVELTHKPTGIVTWYVKQNHMSSKVIGCCDFCDMNHNIKRCTELCPWKQAFISTFFMLADNTQNTQILISTEEWTVIY